MFFHHLKNFSPYSGHIYDEMRTPFIKKKDGYLGRNASRFDLIDRLVRSNSLMRLKLGMRNLVSNKNDITRTGNLLN